MNCQEITTKIQEIKSKKAEFDVAFVKSNIAGALLLKKEIQLLIEQLDSREKFIIIEGKKFPVFNLVIGGKTTKEIETELKNKNIFISKTAKSMLEQPSFTTQSNSEKITLVKLKLEDLGFSGKILASPVIMHAKLMGLDICPAEVGPHLLLSDFDLPKHNSYSIIMDDITNQWKSPSVFTIEHIDIGLRLRSHKWLDIKDNTGFEKNNFIVFRVPNDSKLWLNNSQP